MVTLVRLGLCLVRSSQSNKTYKKHTLSHRLQKVEISCRAVSHNHTLLIGYTKTIGSLTSWRKVFYLWNKIKGYLSQHHYCWSRNDVARTEEGSSAQFLCPVCKKKKEKRKKIYGLGDRLLESVWRTSCFKVQLTGAGSDNCSNWRCAGSSRTSVCLFRACVSCRDMQQSLESLVRLLESYRGRDKVVSIHGDLKIPQGL